MPVQRHRQRLGLGGVAIVARDAKDPFDSYLAAGVFFYFFWQVLINMGMVLGLMPVVGVPLPFISYGGTALVTLFLGLGILMSIHRNRMLVQK